MTDERNLLLNIAADHEDDLVRPAYADLMEEQGDVARAEFIRLQCALARDREDGRLGPGERLAMKAREAELLKAHKAEWAGVAADFDPQFRRGFVERVTLDMADVAAGTERLGQLRKDMPTIAGLKVESDTSMQGNWLTDMLCHEACRGLRELDLEGIHVGVQEIITMAFASGPALERLNLSGCNMPRDALGALASSPYLGRLRELNLKGNRIELNGQALTKTAFPSLEVLNLEESELRANDFRMIANAPFMRYLRQLELGGNYSLSNAAVTVLAGSSQPLALRRLGLQYCGITDDGMAALGRSAQFAELESLSLSQNRIRQQAAQALAASPHLGKLKTLEMWSTDIGNEGLRALIASRALGGLKNLDASHINSWGAYGEIPFDAAAIAALEGLARLRSLKLEENAIDAKMLAALLASKHLVGLQEMSLVHNPIQVTGARALAEASHLSSLQSLDLKRCRLGVEGLRTIADCTRFEALRHLDIGDNLPKESKLQFGEGASSAVGAVGKIPLGMRAQLARDDSRHVTVGE